VAFGHNRRLDRRGDAWSLPFSRCIGDSRRVHLLPSDGKLWCNNSRRNVGIAPGSLPKIKNSFK
jgi:hypothetical protein